MTTHPFDDLHTHATSGPGIRAEFVPAERLYHRRIMDKESQPNFTTWAHNGPIHTHRLPDGSFTRPRVDLRPAQDAPAIAERDRLRQGAEGASGGQPAARAAVVAALADVISPSESLAVSAAPAATHASVPSSADPAVRSVAELDESAVASRRAPKPRARSAARTAQPTEQPTPPAKRIDGEPDRVSGAKRARAPRSSARPRVSRESAPTLRLEQGSEPPAPDGDERHADSAAATTTHVARPMPN